MDNATPTIVKKRAIDVAPYHHSIWCSVGGSELFANEIVSRKWTDDEKRIVFMLDSFNFVFAEPDEMMDVVESKPSSWMSDELLAEQVKRDEEFVRLWTDRAQIERMMAL